MPQAAQVPGREGDDRGVDVDADAVHVRGRRGDVPQVDARPAAHLEHPAGAAGPDDVDEERAEQRLGHPRRAGHELAVAVEVVAGRGAGQPLAEAQVARRRRRPPPPRAARPGPRPRGRPAPGPTAPRSRQRPSSYASVRPTRRCAGTRRAGRRRRRRARGPARRATGADERAEQPGRGRRAQELDAQPAHEVAGQRRVRPLVPQPEARQREVDRVRHVPIMAPPVRP